MIVACPKCKAKYRVDETKIGPQGVKLRCAKCKTIFKVSKKLVAPKAPAQPPPSVQPSAPSQPAPTQMAPTPPTPPPAEATAPPPPPTQAPQPPAEPPSTPSATAPSPPSARAETRIAPPPPPEEKVEEISGPYLPKGEIKAELLLADADETFLNKIGNELVEAGYKVWYARNGEVAFNFIKERKPPVAILEVMLPGLFGFEVCEKVKADPGLKDKVKLVLIGSVYEKNRFRRAPTSLYGADEYVDKYHNGKEVLAKVEKLLGFAEAKEPAPRVAPPPPPSPPSPAEAKPEVKMPSPPPSEVKPEAMPSPPPPSPPVEAEPSKPTQVPSAPAVEPKPAPAPKPAEVKDWKAMVPDDPAHQRAARLARTIAADIALYNPDLVEKGVREGTFWELLAKDIEDGRKHYESKVDPKVLGSTDYFRLALEDLIARKKKELGLE